MTARTQRTLQKDGQAVPVAALDASAHQHSMSLSGNAGLKLLGINGNFAPLRNFKDVLSSKCVWGGESYPWTPTSLVQEHLWRAMIYREAGAYRFSLLRTQLVLQILREDRDDVEKGALNVFSASLGWRVNGTLPEALEVAKRWQHYTALDRFEYDFSHVGV